MNTQEYLVKDTKKVQDFIHNEIGIECEITLSDFDYDGISGSVIAFEVTSSEHNKVKEFITKNNLWE